MTDDENHGASPWARTDDPEMLLYDYSKYLLTLALFGLGGVLSLTQSADRDRFDANSIIGVIGALAVSGMLSLTCANAIVRARRKGEPLTRFANAYSEGAMLFLGLGVGAFLALWTGAI